MNSFNQLFEAAQLAIAGGVNSPVRAFKGVGGTPHFFKSAKGAFLYDEHGREYVDYVGSWGPMILGHAHPQVINAVQSACDNGLSFGAPTVLETEMARYIQSMIPSMERLRMVNSGTEATMSAIRLARGYTGRKKIIKFTGCYHGHVDALLVEAGSGALTLGTPSSPGIPPEVTEHTLSLNFNDSDQVTEMFSRHPDEIACVIVEPVAGNMNCIPPNNGFLKSLRQACDHYEALLIFDEVMTGFRVARGGAQALYDIQPDLTTLGKIIGGGLPVGAYGGRKEIMAHLAPDGPVYQAGTLSGNPIAMTAGLTTLKILNNEAFYEALSSTVSSFCRELESIAKQLDIPLITQSVGGMFGLFFTEKKKISTYEDLASCNIERFNTFFHAMLEQGIYLAPSAYEAGFISSAHTQKEIETTLAAAKVSLSSLSVQA